jgi:hypothetical protein
MSGSAVPTLGELKRRIIERMTPEQRVKHEQGCQIVDFYIDLLDRPGVSSTVRKYALDKLCAFAWRQPGETVSDIDGKAEQ